MKAIKELRKFLDKNIYDKNLNKKELQKIIDNVLKLETTYKLFYKKKIGFYNECLKKDIKKEYKNKLNDPDFENNLLNTDGFSDLKLYYYDILENNNIDLISNIYNDFLLIVKYFIDFNILDVNNLNNLNKEIERVEPD